MMTQMPIFMHFLYSFLASMGFAIFLSAPKKALLFCGFAGAVGWSIFYFLTTISLNDIYSNFLATIFVTLVSEILARKLKQPAIIFIIPGIIPLVPGLGMYNTMLNLVQSYYDEAIAKGANALFIGGAIALGVLIVTSLSNTVNLLILKKIHKG